MLSEIRNYVNFTTIEKKKGQTVVALRCVSDICYTEVASEDEDVNA